MKYDITKSTAPVMPNLGKGIECFKLLLSQASEDMHEPLVPMSMPALSAHLSEVEFMYSDNKYYELCGQMGHLIGPSGIGKDQLHDLIEAIMRSFRDHDEIEYQKLQDWSRQKTTKGSNKDKPNLVRHQRPLRMQYLCTVKKITALNGPDNGVGTPKQRRCFREEKPPLPKMAATVSFYSRTSICVCPSSV